MKGGKSVQRPQSHREPHPAAVAASDDWGDGSWTVDCVCGVNFDDGEEMVNCDDCGVWVHTRCSRYVKGEDLFTCDKCKKRKGFAVRDTHNSNSNNNNNNDSSEETEVAQLLVELPTKTIRLESGGGSGAAAPVAVRRPFRLWTDIPMEDRVHVQGVPGGDPALFGGFGSAVFSPALWKCTGYVPKKFSFRYREFPCWDEEDAGREGDRDLNEGDKGAGVLFSLSKGSGVRERDGDVVKEVSKWGSEVRGLKFGVKKERSLLHPVVLHSGKRKKEDAGMGKDRSARKKARVADREIPLEKRSSSTLRTAFTSTSDPSKPSELLEDRGPRSCKSDTQTSKAKSLRDHVIGVDFRNQSASDKVKDGSEQIDCASEALSAELARPDLMDGVEQKEVEEATDDDIKEAVKLPTADNISAPAVERSDALTSVKEEENVPNDKPSCGVDDLAADHVKPLVQYLDTSVSEAMGDVVNSLDEMKGGDEKLPHSGQSNVKLEVDIDNSRGFLDVQPSAGAENGGMLCKLSADSRVQVSSLGCLPSEDHTRQDTDGPSEKCDVFPEQQGDELSADPCHVGRRKEHLQDLMQTPEDQSKAGSSSSQHKATLQDENSSSSLIAAAITKLSPSDSLRYADTPNTYPNLKQHATSDSSVKKYYSKSSLVQDAERTGKEHQKSSVPSAPKAPNLSKVSHGSSIRRTVSDSKDSVLSSSSKAPPMQNSSEAAGSQQREYASNMQNKATARGDKSNLSNAQLPSKANSVPLANTSAPTTSSAILSDEELALLLHQELNSSPRVPRVPRVRHTGSLPQLASPTAASMLLKRSSSSGGKDHGLFSRRKSKDVSKDAFRRSHEPDDGVKKTTNRAPPSPDLRRQDSGNPSTGREDGGSLAAASSVKNNIPPTSTSTANSGPSSSTEVNDNHLSSMRNSPRDVSDEDTGTARGPVHRTLPGLINEIMSKGRRMTYEELCNAVLPHWNNLRKHNGERYAYSSPSQAVLDCLRNRQEWAQLVDRGPKTNSNRKKRKVDAEESEDNGYSKGRTSKDGEGKNLESQREDFPKGKRKARKRKLALQGRGLKDSKSRRKSDSITDDDSGGYSDATEKSQSSEDEVQDGGAAFDESEPSASSEDDCEA